MSLEQEIKLRVMQEAELDLSGLVWLNDLLESTPYPQHLLSTYFDTPDRALMEFGVGLRLRQVDQQWLQTVKCSGQASDGLHQRKEWEHEIAGPEFDLARLAETDLAPLLENKAVWDAIAPVFTTDFSRLVLPLRLDDGTQIEMAYDVGKVHAGNREQAIHEIELELKKGDIKKCQQLAESLKRALPLEYSDMSKAGIGYSLS
ncbi:CYTH domain-containing protein [Methylophaga sp.]|uniref:CYTH domain-containing protein n=1 Tax=Methylophaga sp. TaxID=2024840 RepID=UPI003F696BBC